MPDQSSCISPSNETGIECAVVVQLSDHCVLERINYQATRTRSPWWCRYPRNIADTWYNLSSIVVVVEKRPVLAFGNFVVTRPVRSVGRRSASATTHISPPRW